MLGIAHKRVNLRINLDRNAILVQTEKARQQISKVVNPLVDVTAGSAPSHLDLVVVVECKPHDGLDNGTALANQIPAFGDVHQLSLAAVDAMLASGAIMTRRIRGMAIGLGDMLTQLRKPRVEIRVAHSQRIARMVSYGDFNAFVQSLEPVPDCPRCEAAERIMERLRKAVNDPRIDINARKILHDLVTQFNSVFPQRINPFARDPSDEFPTLPSDISEMEY